MKQRKYMQVPKDTFFYEKIRYRVEVKFTLE